MSCKSIWIVAGALSLAGCNTANTHIGDADPGFGEAVKFNAAVQIINPTPVYGPGDAQPGENGDRGAAAVKRYRTDQVNDRHAKEAKTLSTTKSISGTGGPQ